MKKNIPIKYYYIAFFVCNIFASFALLRGWFNPNISPTNDFLSIFFSIIGDLGIIGLVFILVQIICKKDKKKVLALNIASFVFVLLVLFLHCFATLFSTFFSYTQLTSFKNPSQGKLIGTYILYFLRIFTEGYLILPSIILILLYVFSYFIDKSKNVNYKFKPKMIFLGLTILSMIIPVGVLQVKANNTADEISMNSLYGASNVGAYNYYVYSIKDLVKSEEKLDDNELKVIQEFLNEHEYKLDQSNPYIGIGEDKNLIIVQLEAINNFIIGLEIDGELVAPNLTYLSQNYYYNNRFYSSAGMGNTSDCEFSSNIGLYPNGNDLSIFELDGDNYPTIAKEFKKLGYKTMSIHGNDGGFYNRNNQHISLFGFDEHIDKVDLLARNSNLSIVKDWISDEALLNESINIYNELESKFFSYNILVSSHAPFGVRDGIEEYNNKALTSLANAYIANVKYVDKCVGEYIEKLKANGLFDNSIIIMYGDHTSTLLRKDAECLTGKNYSDVEFRMEMQNVPFMIISDEIEAQVDSSVHSNIDIYPTIAALYNMDAKYKFGTDIFSNESSFAYGPRSLDIIFDDYVIMVPSKTVYYTSNNSKKLSKAEINEYIKWFKEYKYANDLVVATNYFK